MTRKIMKPSFTEKDLAKLRDIVEDRAKAFSLSRERLALTLDTSEEIKRAYDLSQKITEEMERIYRREKPLDDLTLLDLGFEAEFDPPDSIYTIELVQTGEDEYLFGIGFLKESRLSISFELSNYGDLLEDTKRDPVLKCPDVRTVGELLAAFDVATNFGRIEPYVVLDDIPFQDEDTGETQSGEDLSGVYHSGKDYDLYDQIPF